MKSSCLEVDCHRAPKRVGTVVIAVLGGSLAAQGEWIEARKQNLAAAGSSAHSGALVDLDGDGGLDLFTAQFASPNFDLFRNRGHARFDRWSAVALPNTGSFYPAVGDVDGDGDSDIAVPGGVLMNRAPSAPTFVAFDFGNVVHECADFTGDGRADIFGSSGLLRSLPNGTFALIASPPVPGDLTDCAAVDLDRDGDLDLVLACTRYSTTLGVERVWRNDGIGNFTDLTAQWFPSAPADETTMVLAGDLDGDGAPDCALRGPGGTWIMRRNDGAGVLQPWSTAPANGGIRLVDLDGDGDLDLPGESNWLSNDGNGVFVSVRWAPAGRFSLLAIGDVNGDGRPDLCCRDSQPLGMLRLLLNRLPAPFVDASELAGVPMYPYSRIAAGDADGDGDIDLLRPGDGLYRNDGSGWMQRVPAAFAPVASASRFVDIDRDGDQDLISLAGGQAGPLTVARNLGSGNFTLTASIAVGGLHLLPFDADGDGSPEVVLDGIRLLRNDGAGAFALDPNPPIGGAQCGVAAAADFDGDGDVDLLAADTQLQMFVNDGAGVFAWTPTRLGVIPGQVGPTAIEPFDADGDGDIDAFVGQQSGAALMLRNIGSGVLVSWAAALPPMSGVVAATAVDADGDGDRDLIARNQQRVLWCANDGTGHMVDPVAIIDGTFLSLAVVDIDGDADLDIAVDEHLFVSRLWHARAPYVPQTGTDYVVEIASIAMPNCLAVPFAGVRATMPLPPFGTLGLDPAQLMPLPLVAVLGTSGSLSIAIPAGPALVGLEFGVQAILTDGSRFHLSPVVHDTVYF